MAAKKEILVLRGHVSKTGFRNESGFSVFSLRPLKDVRKVIQCSGVVETMPRVDDAIEVYGYFDSNSKYAGIQFKVTGYSHISGIDELQVARFLMSFAKFLGDVKAREIARHFGQDLEKVLDDEPDRLLEVPGVGKTIRDNIVSGWATRKGTRNLSLFLMKLGLPDFRIKQITSKRGLGYEEKIKADPYLLMDDGLGFSAADNYAESLQVAPGSPLRYRGFLQSAVKNFTQTEGHLFVPTKEVVTAVNEFNGTTHRKFDPMGVSYAMLRPHLDSLIQDGYLVEEGPNLYAAENFFFEAASAERMSAMMTAPGALAFEGVDLPTFVEDYETTESFRTSGFRLADQQREALESFVTEKVMVVTGAPGTGKTTVVRSFVKILKDHNLRFVLLAPTGKAAKRLEETAGHPAYTIHRKLGYQGDAWDYGFQKKLQVDTVLVDEFSMVDQQLLFRLLDAMPPEAKLVMVGDHNQLPSVGAGNVLRDLIASGRVHTITLSKVHRQAETSDIVRVANQIKDGAVDMSLFRVNDLKADVCMLRTGTDTALAEKHITELCKTLKAKGNVSFQVLSPRNEGDLSVSSLNISLQEALNPKTPESGLEAMLEGGVKVRRGDRVRITKNHYGLGIFNGDVGKVLLVSVENLKVDIEGSGVITIPLKDLRDIVSLGYMSSIHKAQGSEFQVVILALLKSHGQNLLQRNLLYTAITRAKKKVIIVGQDAAIVSAIENDKIRLRNTALAARIGECLDHSEDPEFLALRKLLELPESAPNYATVRGMLFPGKKDPGGAPDEGEEMLTGIEERQRISLLDPIAYRCC